MSRLLRRSFSRLVAPALALAVAVLLVPCTASATPYVVKLMQQGSNVVAHGGGEFDLSGLTSSGTFGLSNAVWPANGYVGTGPQNALVTGYRGISGPSNFGPSANLTFANAGTGDAVALNWASGLVFMPQGYVSGTALANTSTWDNASFASLGVTPGTYTWTWGTGADQSFTLIISNTVGVPEPAALGMFGLGMLLLGGFVTLRRRGQQRAC